MGQLFVKEDVDFRKGLAPAGQLIYDVLLALTKNYPFNMTITSAYDGVHSGPGDPHYRGEALDIRSQHLTRAQKARVVADLQAALYVSPRRFYAFLEAPGTRNEHFHVQLRKGLRNYTADQLADVRSAFFKEQK